MSKKICGIIFLVFLLFFGCKQKESPVQYEITFSGKTMGTSYSIKVELPDSSGIAKKSEMITIGVNNVLQSVDRMMSTYKVDSEVSRFNNFTDTNWFPISKEFAKVVSAALEIGKASNGALDITVEPLVNLWGFGPKEKRITIPDSQEVKTLLNITGIDKIKIGENPTAIKKSIPETEIDLSSIAKGYGVDKAAEYLLKNGYNNFMVEVGGEVRASGKNANFEEWNIGVSNPVDRNKIIKVVQLSADALATSGDYYNYFEYRGKIYSHTIDPTTGYPVTHNLVSVSVIHNSCMYADGYATAIDVLGPEKGLTFAKKMKLPVYLISKRNDSLVFSYTDQFLKYLKNERRKNK
ncbi:MAG: FAD:protein FMN transferase [Chlorobi bacterium]|nr:FAD:protein FMN transferase [Chlorobiota bacterium]